MNAEAYEAIVRLGEISGRLFSEKIVVCSFFFVFRLLHFGRCRML